ncbi:MAG: hypothetical protein GXY72_00200 [Deltaproteobacteria bacterium]|nr:hypothetical protein [Deltaproteobacteria bacterium]
MTENKLTAQFEFTGSGCLKAILLNAWSEKEQATLECALDRLFKPQHFGWIQKFLRRRQTS